MKTLRILLAAVVIGVGLAVVSTVPADAAQTRWSGRTVYVQESLPGGYDVKKAIEIWDNKTRLNLVLVKKCPSGKQCIKFSAGNRPGNAIATATRWMLGNKIVECTVEVDTKALNKMSKARRLSTLSHETGHCLGFAHVAKTTDVMNHYSTAKRGWKPSAKYYKALKKIYG